MLSGVGAGLLSFVSQERAGRSQQALGLHSFLGALAYRPAKTS